jgi:uncharacterized protein (TIGR02246 family)
MTGLWAVEKLNPALGRKAIEPHLLLISEEIVSHSTECATSQEGLMTVADVKAVAKAFHDGVANQDAAALASLYHDDGRFLPPNMEPAEGREAIRAALQQLLDMGAARWMLRRSTFARPETSRSKTAVTSWASNQRAGRL